MNNPPSTIRVLLAEDHGGMRDALAKFLATLPDIEVVGTAADGPAAIDLAVRLAPDIVLMDVRLPGIEGVEATRRIRETVPRTRVLALSAHSDRRVVEAMAQAGADGYVPKSNVVRELAPAIRAVAAGQTYVSPRLGGQ